MNTAECLSTCILNLHINLASATSVVVPLSLSSNFAENSEAQEVYQGSAGKESHDTTTSCHDREILSSKRGSAIRDVKNNKPSSLHAATSTKLFPTVHKCPSRYLRPWQMHGTASTEDLRDADFPSPD